MNEFFIGMQGDDIVFLRPVPQRITMQQAIALAAWLVAMADPLREQFDSKLAEICS